MIKRDVNLCHIFSDIELWWSERRRRVIEGECHLIAEVDGKTCRSEVPDKIRAGIQPCARHVIRCQKRHSLDMAIKRCSSRPEERSQLNNLFAREIQRKQVAGYQLSCSRI